MMDLSGLRRSGKTAVKSNLIIVQPRGNGKSGIKLRSRDKDWHCRKCCLE